MSTRRRLVTRRFVLASIGVVAMLFGLSMFHSYPRQLLFGPKINGVRWCVWENAIRQAAHLSPQHWFYRTLEDLRLVRNPTRADFDTPDLLPVFIAMSDDDDREVRWFVLSYMDRYALLPGYWRWSEEDRERIRGSCC